MIVRLMGEGQWRVDDGLHARIDALDAGTEEAVAGGDADALRRTLEAIHALVREEGEQLEETHLGESDLVVPPADLSLEEARELLQGEGLVPDLPSS